MQPDLESKRRRTELAAKGVGLLILSLILGPFFVTILHGLGAIAALVVGGGAVFTTWKFLPWFGMKIGNLRLKAIKAEAMKNPVETLENELLEASKQLDNRQTNIERLDGQIRTFADKVDEIKERYGANDSGYIKLSKDLLDLRRIHADRVAKWKRARLELDKFSEAIDRGRMIWDAAAAAAAARETSGLTEDEFFAKLRTETAFDSIQQGYNEALASLDTSMLEQPEAVNQLAAPVIESDQTRIKSLELQR